MVASTVPDSISFFFSRRRIDHSRHWVGERSHLINREDRDLLFDRMYETSEVEPRVTNKGHGRLDRELNLAIRLQSGRHDQNPHQFCVKHGTPHHNQN